MEVRFYTPTMELIGIMENQTSILWRRKYYEPGTFEIYAPITEYNAKLCVPENVVQIEGAKEAGVIEDVLYQQENHYNKVRISGRFLSSYLDRRIINPRITFSGFTELAMRQIVSNYIDKPPATLPNWKLGALNNYTERVAFQATYKNALTYMVKLSKSSNIGFRTRPDFTNKVQYFETYKGADHSNAQGVRTRVIFSEGYQNMNSAKWQTNSQLLRTVGFIGGEGEGVNRTVEKVGDHTLTGLSRREVFIDARDLQKAEMDTSQYSKALQQRGAEKMDAMQMVTSLECTATPNGNFVYRRDYDLGDIVTVRKESWGVSEDKRITELLEVYENGTMVVTPTLGTTLPETIDWRDDDVGT